MNSAIPWRINRADQLVTTFAMMFFPFVLVLIYGECSNGSGMRGDLLGDDVADGRHHRVGDLFRHDETNPGLDRSSRVPDLSDR